MSKILSQENFKKGIKPRPGMIFYDENDNLYIILDKHPNVRAGEPGIAFEAGDSKDNSHFWAIRQLVDKEIESLLK